MKKNVENYISIVWRLQIQIQNHASEVLKTASTCVVFRILEERKWDIGVDIGPDLPIKQNFQNEIAQNWSK